ncbi:uncharacterized protein LOC107460058 isoform X2 [Arachis duranensis]|uniref:Uncharacterized protein LOC107460058 isoform X2 n=1 Tax=Arachis duranensis TaxID=130453 RepID=A0A9C6WNS2_ARADU|nr:uncharacterized protein LOC107460058 isoform X2 [Arachis duranensis]
MIKLYLLSAPRPQCISRFCSAAIENLKRGWFPNHGSFFYSVGAMGSDTESNAFLQNFSALQETLPSPKSSESKLCFQEQGYGCRCHEEFI